MRAYTYDEFSDRVGESFELLLDERRTLPMTLGNAQALPYSGREGGAFTLEWVGPYEPVLEQGIYSLRSGDETFEIFIVPIARNRDGVRYQAVFN
jgi:hypothetical protein